MSAYPRGLIDQKRHRMTSLSAIWRKSNMASPTCIFLLFCIQLIFSWTNKQFTVASHNLHGFKKSSEFHKQCINNFGGLWFAQELWLPENRLSQLCSLGVQFVARSGMEEAVSSGIMRGRPHGGVSIAWSPDMDEYIRPLINYRHKRIVGVELRSEPQSLLFISAYMPFLIHQIQGVSSNLPCKKTPYL